MFNIAPPKTLSPDGVTHKEGVPPENGVPTHDSDRGAESNLLDNPHPIPIFPGEKAPQFSPGLSIRLVSYGCYCKVNYKNWQVQWFNLHCTQAE
jgi:hypothetical protein